MANTKERILGNLSRFEAQPNVDPRVMSVVMTLREILTINDGAENDDVKKEILSECLDVDTLSHPSIAGMTHICRQIKDTMLLIGLFPSENRRKRLPLRIAEGLGFDQEAIAEIEAAIATGPPGHDQSAYSSQQSEPHTQG
jgi:hypothetical protein